MKLISCDGCASVFDQDKLNFTEESDAYDYGGSIRTDKFVWDGDDYIAFLPCPICSEAITKEK